MAQELGMTRRTVGMLRARTDALVSARAPRRNDSGPPVAGLARQRSLPERPTDQI